MSELHVWVTREVPFKETTRKEKIELAKTSKDFRILEVLAQNHFLDVKTALFENPNLPIEIVFHILRKDRNQEVQRKAERYIDNWMKTSMPIWVVLVLNYFFENKLDLKQAKNRNVMQALVFLVQTFQVHFDEYSCRVQTYFGFIQNKVTALPYSEHLEQELQEISCFISSKYWRKMVERTNAYLPGYERYLRAFRNWLFKVPNETITIEEWILIVGKIWCIRAANGKYEPKEIAKYAELSKQRFYVSEAIKMLRAKSS